MKYQELNSTKLAISSGIVCAAIIFLTTLTAVYGKSNFARFFMEGVWSSLGYSISWSGAIVGAILGFIYTWIIVKITSGIYNKLI